MASGSLHRFRDALEQITALGMVIYPVSDQDVLRAAESSQTHGLLSNDALVVSIMENHRVTHLASNDDDFDRVSWLTRYTPK
jgi:predicted nucleic acid-binding protein